LDPEFEEDGTFTEYDLVVQNPDISTGFQDLIASCKSHFKYVSVPDVCIIRVNYGNLLMNSFKIRQLDQVDFSTLGKNGSRKILYAVIIHLGTNSNYGHYIALVKDVDESWNLYDDTIIRKLTFSEGESFIKSKNPVLLFYRRINGEIVV